MTLALRVRQQNSNALRLARFLGGHSAVKRVIYPGLENHPQHTRAKELFQGYGGVLAFEARGGEEETSALLGRLKIAVVAPSLGGVHTLVGLNPSYEVRLADAGVVFRGLGPGGGRRREPRRARSRCPPATRQLPNRSRARRRRETRSISGQRSEPACLRLSVGRPDPRERPLVVEQDVAAGRSAAGRVLTGSAAPERSPSPARPLAGAVAVRAGGYQPRSSQGS